VTTVAVLGLGPMGQALGGALLDAGYRTTVWNRTESKSQALRARGAQWAAGPAEAVAASELTLVNVVDHDVVDSLLEAVGGDVDGRVIVGLSSDTPDRSRQTAKLVGDRGGRYLDGAIMTPTASIGTSSASVLFAGPYVIYDAHRDVFGALGDSTWLGEDHGCAAAFDMSVLDVFWTSVSGFLHAVMVARANGITPTELLPHANGIAGILPPIFAEFAERIENEQYDESSAPVSSVAASVRHLITASRDAGVDAGVLEAFRAYVDAAVAAGHGADEVSRVASAMTR